MQTLEVTDEQHAVIQHLREEMAAQVVGKYGHVRERDAVQFLIDNLDGELDVDATFDPSEIADAGADEKVTYDETDDVTDGDEASDADSDGDDEDAEADDSAGDDGSATDDDMLDRMMNLLETHDDKWEESPSADYRYRVELPDGSTEDVQTKDDVRALLFKNY